MPTTFETGHTINVARFEDLISLCEGFGLIYNPAQMHLKVDALKSLRRLAEESLTGIASKQPDYNHAVAEREAIFATISPLTTRIISALIASGVPKRSIDNAKTIIRKLQGQRATPIAPTDPNSTEPAPKTISASQMSFDSRIGNFERLVEILAAEPEYRPNEVPLQTATLQALLLDLKAKNTAVINANTALINARIARDKVLYQDTHCLLNTVVETKAYVKSVFGSKSTEYQNVSKLKFSKKNY